MLSALPAHDQRPGPWLLADLDHEHPELKLAAVDCARFADPNQVQSRLAALAQSEDPDLRRATMASALHLGLPGAWELARY